MLKEKALIKETGQILEVEGTYIVRHTTVSFNIDISEEDLKELQETTFTYSGDSKEEGTYYNLSDGKEYVEGNLIIGLDNIREEKLKDII